MNLYKVVIQYGRIYVIKNDLKEMTTQLSGKFEHGIVLNSEFPAVGDWVTVNETGLINSVVNRKNSLSRKKVGKKYEQQIVAANIDFMFIVISLDQEIKLHKINRLLILAKTNRIEAVIILTKSDISMNVGQCIKLIQEKFKEITIIISGKENDNGLNSIKQLLSKGKTGVFIGPSGVGKSTLVNKLLGEEVAKISEVRLSDKKGRHTTTNRQLYELENKSYIIDTPGIREIGLWINTEEFVLDDDIDILSEKCRFKNCSHRVEPGCAVLLALEKGNISKKQYEKYLKLKNEVDYATTSKNEMMKYIYEKNKKIKERKQMKNR